MQHRIGAVAVVFNDASYGTIARIQQRQYGREVGAALHNPDFVQMADAFGAHGRHVESPEQLYEALLAASPAVADAGRGGEDIAQLIFDLKCSNPEARVSVKLVVSPEERAHIAQAVKQLFGFEGLLPGQVEALESRAVELETRLAAAADADHHHREGNPVQEAGDLVQAQPFQQKANAESERHQQ